MGKDAAPSTGGVKDWATLFKVAERGFSDGIICLATIEIVERANRPAVREPLKVANASLAARILVDSSLVRLHLYVVRAFADVSYRDDLHLRAAINYLRGIDIDRQVQNPSQRNDLRTAIDLFDTALKDPRLRSLKRLRNKQIAHLGKYDDRKAPQFKYLLGFTKVVAEIWERLAWGVDYVSVPLSFQLDEYVDSAEAFWSPWEDNFGTLGSRSHS